MLQSCFPGFCKQISAFFSCRCQHRGLCLFFSAKITQGLNDFIIRTLRRIPQSDHSGVSFQQIRVHIFPRRRRRKTGNNCQFHRPAHYIAAHPAIADPGINIFFNKNVQLLQTVLRRNGSDPVEQFVHINICRRRRNRPVYPASNICTPRKISAQLSCRQIVIGRKITYDAALPGCIVVIVFHKFCLTEKVFCPAFYRVSPVIIQTPHLPDPLRDFFLPVLKAPASFSRKRKGDILPCDLLRRF